MVAVCLGDLTDGRGGWAVGGFVVSGECSDRSPAVGSGVGLCCPRGTARLCGLHCCPGLRHATDLWAFNSTCPGPVGDEQHLVAVAALGGFGAPRVPFWLPAVSSPRKQVLSLEERKRAIEEQMELDALKAKQRAQQAQGAIGIVRGMAQAARGTPTPESSEQASSTPTAVRDRGQTEPQVDEQGVRAEPAAPLAELVPSSAGLPMAWPSVSEIEEQTVPTHNGRRERSRRS